MFGRKSETSEEPTAMVGEPAVVGLRALAARYDIRVSEASIKEAWEATGTNDPIIRFMDAAQRLGLDPIPARLDQVKDGHAGPIIVEHDAGGVFFDGPKGIALDGSGEVDLPTGTRPRVWTFTPSDTEDRSAEARLKAINPIKTLGTSRLGWVILAGLISNILGLATSLFVMVVYDRVLPYQATESLYALAAGVAIAVLFDVILKNARSAIVETAAHSADRKVTEDLFDQFVEARPQNGEKSVGQLSSVIRNFEVYREFMTSAMLLTLVDLPFVFLFIFVIGKIAGLIWVVPALAVPTVLILVALVQPIMVKSSNRYAGFAQSRQALLVEILSGLDHLRVTGAYAILKRKFLVQAGILNEAGAQSKNASQWVGTVIGLVQQVFQVAMIVVGFHLFVSGTITMGAIIGAVILFGRVMAPLSRVGQTIGRANQALTSYRMVRDFLALDRRTDAGVPVVSAHGERPAIELSNVTLRLSKEGEAVLEQVNLKVQRGEKIALVGRTGSGKTSLLRLMCGLLVPESGAVLCDGVPVGAYPRADLNRRIGTVFQTPWMFAGTLRDNVGLGHMDLGDDRLLKALRLTGLGDDPSQARLMSLDMPVAEQGANLSGGQRQAINIARALAPDPDILLMDEPSSAMDAQLEAHLVRQIKSDLAEKTFVIVTHKAKILDLCDRVVVVDRGRIVGDMPARDYFAAREARTQRVQAGGAS